MPLGVSVRPKAQQGINPMDQKKIERINELARKSKAEGLTDAEKQEQQALREEGILVRHFSSDRLKPWLRVTVGTAEDMEKVTEALIRLIKK